MLEGRKDREMENQTLGIETLQSTMRNLASLTEQKWTWETEPVAKQGWYAIAFQCGGLLSGAAWWDGVEWKSQLPVVGHAGPFDSELSAYEWADLNAHAF